MKISELKKLSLEELRELNSKVISVIKLKKNELALEVKENLSVGASVVVDHPKLKGKELVIEKINRTKAHVRVVDSFTSFNVPLNMISLS